jgi:hypothetical protein
MLCPTPVKFGALFGGEFQYALALGLAETLPERDRQVGSILSGKLEQFRKRVRLHVWIVSRAGRVSNCAESPTVVRSGQS